MRDDTENGVLIRTTKGSHRTLGPAFGLHFRPRLNQCEYPRVRHHCVRACNEQAMNMMNDTCHYIITAVLFIQPAIALEYVSVEYFFDLLLLLRLLSPYPLPCNILRCRLSPSTLHRGLLLSRNQQTVTGDYTNDTYPCLSQLRPRLQSTKP